MDPSDSSATTHLYQICVSFAPLPLPMPSTVSSPQWPCPNLAGQEGLEGVSVKPVEEVSAPQLFVPVPIRLLVSSIVLVQLRVRLHAKPSHRSDQG